MQKGDFILVEFWLRDQAGRLIQTTSEELAKKEGIHRPEAPYGPRLVILGEGTVIPGFEDALTQAIIGDAKEISIPPEKAFGVRREDFVRLLPLAEFRARGREPKQGELVEVNDVVGRVQTISSGRVRVDFNPEYSGQTIKAWFRVAKKVDSAREKVEALANEERELKAKGVSLSEGTARIAIPSSAKKDASFFVAKARFSARTFANLPEVKKITFEEDWERES
jgi:peptidylprolyl isomerase